MNPIKFATSRKGEVFEYHFHPSDEERTIGKDEHFSNNERLWKDWCDRGGLPESYEMFNISNLATGENVLLYMLLVWELSKGKDLLGIGIWETDYIERYINQTPEYVDWEYKLEHEFIIRDKFTRKNIGFKKAKSPVITQYDKPINKTPINKTGIFKLRTFRELADFLKPGFGDASNLSNFYITDNPDTLTNKLGSIDQPSFDSLLNKEDIFIGLLIGQDMGYYDYLLISSKSDLTEILMLISRKLNDFAHEYKSGIKTVETSDEMIDLIENGLKKYALQHALATSRTRPTGNSR